MLTLASQTVIDTPEPFIKKYLNKIFRRSLSVGRLDVDMFNHTNQSFLKGLGQGWGKPFAGIEFNTPDWEYIQNLKYNTAVFAAFKQNSEISDAYKLLVDDKGNQRNWKEFYAEARKQSHQYNRVWLQTEFNQASQSALTSRQWREFEENADLFPNLRYKTVKDENVRLSHRVLHNKVYPINHPFWDTYYPPNGWGCRCTVEQTDDEPDAELPTELPTMPEYMKNNTGKTAKVWNEQHPYYGTERAKEVLNFVHEQIKPSTDVLVSFNRFKSFGEAYKQLSFNGNNGGFQVVHKQHHFDKVGGKYERAIGRKLEAIGKEVEFNPSLGEISTKVNGQAILFKGTNTTTSNGVKKLLKNASQQKADDVIIYQRFRDTKVLKEGIGRATGTGVQLPNVWYFNKDGRLIKLYKKGQL